MNPTPPSHAAPRDTVDRSGTLDAIARDIDACTRCPELRAYCARIAVEKKRAHRDETYWGRPVPGFGAPDARVVLVGLAPGAHGSNRTGRMFTGDASGVWLYRALHRAGFASQAEQRDRDDGMTLRGCFITAAGRCAPPDNKPTPGQLANCFPYLVDELRAFAQLRVVVGLGAIGTRAARSALIAAGYAFVRPHRFGHGVESLATRADTADVTLLSSYHPSRQNTNTGVLTEAMLDAIFSRARALASACDSIERHDDPPRSAGVREVQTGLRSARPTSRSDVSGTGDGASIMRSRAT
ncbi:MAG: uracil-DNA glycosylase family protein [Vulcanimicrobiaceae bacterium]